MRAQWRLYGFRIALALYLTGIAPSDEATAKEKRWSLLRHLVRFSWRGPRAFEVTSKDAMRAATERMYAR